MPNHLNIPAPAQEHVGLFVLTTERGTIYPYIPAGQTAQTDLERRGIYRNHGRAKTVAATAKRDGQGDLHPTKLTR